VFEGTHVWIVCSVNGAIQVVIETTRPIVLGQQVLGLIQRHDEGASLSLTVIKTVS